MFYALLLALACTPDSPGNHHQSSAGDTADDTDQFGGAVAVRIDSPASGETVEPAFTLRYHAGKKVESVGLFAADVSVIDLTPAEDDGTLAVTLPEGRTTLHLVGYDAGGNEISSDDRDIRVSAGGPWVTITSPADGANVANPVTFTIAASEDVDSVELQADGWALGTVDTTDGEGQLTYTFSGTGYAREITASGGGASDALTLTVEPEENPEASDFNAIVTKYLESYPTDGTDGYYWPSGTDWLGTTQDIWYRGELVAEGDAEGRCYCVGLTWEVYMRAWAEVDKSTGGDGTINGMSVADLDDFRVDWFVRDLDGPGPSIAMETYGVGEEITDVSKLRPGDFVQFWRHSGSGHNVIFVDWVKDGDEITGLEYWSTQSSTDGIAYRTEYFGSSGSSIDPNLVYGARGWMPDQWVNVP